MTELALIMPMAGRGSRFTAQGILEPKPLISIAGQPSFWWAVESIRRQVTVREMVFVVLKEHIDRHAIDKAILDRYSNAQIIALDDVTSGSAETAAIGMEAIRSPIPVAINDCDHAFVCPQLDALVAKLQREASGAIVGFSSQNPAYSYVRFAPGETPSVIGTVEKQCVGPYAIAGCYLFRDQTTFKDAWAEYKETYPYNEPFVSGLYNEICAKAGSVLFQPLARHFSFGTPEELERLDQVALRAAFDERATC